MALAKPTDAPSITYRHDAVHTCTHMELHVRHRYPPSNAENEHTQKHSEETMHACAPIIQAGYKKVRALTVALIICACKNSCGHTDGCLLHAMCEAQEQGCTSSRALKEGARGQGLLHEDKSAHGRTPRTRIRVHKNKGALNSASKLLDIHAPPHITLHHLSVRCGLWTLQLGFKLELLSLGMIYRCSFSAL
jgi:hypothetical protein